MIKHSTIIKIYNEIKYTKKELNKKEADELKVITKDIKSQFTTFTNQFPELLQKIVDRKLDNFIPKMVLVHKTKNLKKKSIKKFQKLYPILYKSIREGQILQILKEVRKIKQVFQELYNTLELKYDDKRQEMITYFETTYPDFKEKNPRLLSGMLNNTLNDSTLQYMFGMYKQFEEKRLSEHDASVKFGTHLVDKYVKPQLKENKDK